MSGTNEKCLIRSYPLVFASHFVSLIFLQKLHFSNFKKFIFLKIMCIYVFLPNFMCTVFVCSELVEVRGFQIPQSCSFRPLLAISYGSGNWTRVFRKSVMCSYCRTISPAPFKQILFFTLKILENTNYRNRKSWK